MSPGPGLPLYCCMYHCQLQCAMPSASAWDQAQCWLASVCAPVLSRACLAAEDPGHDGVAVHLVQAAQQRHRREAPVHAAQPEVLRCIELECVRLL